MRCHHVLIPGLTQNQENGGLKFKEINYAKQYQSAMAPVPEWDAMLRSGHVLSHLDIHHSFYRHRH